MFYGFQRRRFITRRAQNGKKKNGRSHKTKSLKMKKKEEDEEKETLENFPSRCQQ